MVSRDHKAPDFLDKAPILWTGVKFVFLSVLPLTKSTDLRYKYI